MSNYFFLNNTLSQFEVRTGPGRILINEQDCLGSADPDQPEETAETAVAARPVMLNWVLRSHRGFG